MTTFTVHEPLPRKSEEVAPPERFAFVRDGFYFWAFVLGPVWMLYHRLWLVFAMYMVGIGAIQVGLWALAASALVKFTVSLLIALLVGFEAGSLRRWSLRRWINRGIVVAHNREAAEHRFFDRWNVQAPASTSTEPPPAPPQPPAHVPTSDHDIIGLFPQPQSRP
jgi:hypothetical protein